MHYLQAEGGGLAFIEANLSEEDNSSGRRKHGLLAFINGYHEYILFDPFDGQELVEQSVSIRRSSAAEETGALSSTQSSITWGLTSEYLFYCQIWIQNSYGAHLLFLVFLDAVLQKFWGTHLCTVSYQSLT